MSIRRIAHGPALGHLARIKCERKKYKNDSPERTRGCKNLRNALSLCVISGKYFFRAYKTISRRGIGRETRGADLLLRSDIQRLRVVCTRRRYGSDILLFLFVRSVYCLNVPFCFSYSKYTAVHVYKHARGDVFRAKSQQNNIFRT